MWLANVFCLAKHRYLKIKFVPFRVVQYKPAAYQNRKSWFDENFKSQCNKFVMNTTSYLCSFNAVIIKLKINSSKTVSIVAYRQRTITKFSLYSIKNLDFIFQIESQE